MHDQIWVAIELRRDDLERQAHRQYSMAGFSVLWTELQPMKRLTARGRKRPGRVRQAREAIVPDGDPIWLTSGYLILAHDGAPEFWNRVMGIKWPRGGPIALQPVRIAGSDRVPAKAIAGLQARCGEALVPDYMPELSPGQRVRILSEGVFSGYEGTIGELEGGCRVVDTGTMRIRVREHELAPATVERSMLVPLSQ